MLTVAYAFFGAIQKRTKTVALPVKTDTARKAVHLGLPGVEMIISKINEIGNEIIMAVHLYTGT
jgi:hypothetical protein